MVIGVRFLSACAVVASLASVAPAGGCGPGTSPGALLEEARRDRGPNRGASCGYAALAGTRVPGYPATLAAAMAGRPWDRAAMMAMAVRAYRMREEEAAQAAALCSQAADPAGRTCLAANPAELRAWFEARLLERPPRPDRPPPSASLAALAEAMGRAAVSPAAAGSR